MKIVAKGAGQKSALQSYRFLPAKRPKRQINVLKNENYDQKICQFKNSRYICGVEFIVLLLILYLKVVLL